MGLGVGSHEVEIQENSVRNLGGKSAVSLLVADIETGAQDEVLIFLTDKAMNMARASLKRCGFDCDAQDLELLDTNRKLLAGTRIPVKVEMWNGREQAKVDLSGPPAKSEMKRLTEALRAAKGRSEGPSFADDPPPPGDDDIPC